MTSNYDDLNLNQTFAPDRRDFMMPQEDISNLDDNEMGNANLDCFELLSAYLDGEATVEERRQVQTWLDNDPEIKKMYIQLSRLHHGIQNLPAPEAVASSTELSARVFQSIDRTQRKRKVVIWGGGAIAALVLATISNLFTGSGNVPALRLAESPEQKTVSSPVMVAVAVNKPTVIIPKAAVSSQSQQFLENNY